MKSGMTSLLSYYSFGAPFHETAHTFYSIGRFDMSQITYGREKNLGTIIGSSFLKGYVTFFDRGGPSRYTSSSLPQAILRGEGETE